MVENILVSTQQNTQFFLPRIVPEVNDVHEKPVKCQWSQQEAPVDSDYPSKSE